MSASSFPGRVAVQLHVIVVGAGIAGLSAALALNKGGHEVVVCLLST
jgi:monoamine oxidase